jgi:hypothetical protein
MILSVQPKTLYTVGQNVKVIDGQYKGQVFTVKSAQISGVTLIRDSSKPASFYNTLTLPNSKVIAA